MGDVVESCEFLHGVLDATVFEAEHLCDSIYGFLIEALEAVEEALHLSFLPHTKLYAVIYIGTASVGRTREIKFHARKPVWNESFRAYCAHPSPIYIYIINRDYLLGDKPLGRATIPTSYLREKNPVDRWFDLFDVDGNKLKKARVRLLLKFNDATSDPCWNAGIRPTQFSGVPNTYFPQRTGCRVTLFQNSHLSNHFAPVIPLSNGETYNSPRLWEDLFLSISAAKHFIYVAGWSVNAKITLVRDQERTMSGAEDVSIGDLLKRKAKEGVTVLVMLWKDLTSVLHDGVMKTHGRETKEFFEGSEVKCFLCPRIRPIRHAKIAIEFTHHQKTVLLDAPIRKGARGVVCYLGGIDICDGRYDDEQHTLFRNLDSIYLHDFQQKNFPHADLEHGGPREPWHDAHSKLEGPAAWDVLTNFEQRWKKAAPKAISHCLLDIWNQPDVFPFPTGSEWDESWNVQVFRSIDNSSVEGFPSDPSEAAEMGLARGKDTVIDQSIHSGYIEAIRRAKRFIYIENQYFFGSCTSWRQYQFCGCSNLVPIEIALKIASKIYNGERFAAYIVTPMWPEGVPDGDTVQAILRWNWLTMEMMYGIVARAIKDKGLVGKVHPCDYLNFFCLGNREVEHPNDYCPSKRPEHGTHYQKAQDNRRFLIYVHAKLMIVDDEYVIVGSANLNQRSLEGGRDTEIAHGSYQPAHLNELDGPARGKVHGYRVSLWYEHFMNQHRHHKYDVFLEPESLKCVKAVREVAEELWKKFVGEEVVDLPGHLLPFPVRVSEDGELSELPENGVFPDTKAHVKGKKANHIPSILTT